MKTIRVRTSYTGCPYITAGKVYEGAHVQDSLYEIMGNNGLECDIQTLGRCAHLDFMGTWEILPDDDIAEELAKALETILNHVEDMSGKVIRADNQCTLCHTYRMIGHDALAKYRSAKQ